MGERRSALTAGIAATIAVAMLIGAPSPSGAPTVDAKGPKALVPCPKKVGGYKLDGFSAFPEHGFQTCDYLHPNPKKGGSVSLEVQWYPDIEGKRDQCSSRSPRLTEHDHGDVWLLEGPTRRVDGSIAFHGDPRVSLAVAEAALQRLIGSGEPLAHPFVPPVEAMPSDGLSCPLLLPGDLVRSDWYGGVPQTVVTMDDGAYQRYQLTCRYEPAYAEAGDQVFAWVEWYESDPSETALCSAKSIEKRGSTKYWRGYHPVAVEVGHEFAERWGGQILADALEAAAAAQTQPCPDAPEGPAPYEAEPDVTEPGVAARTTTTIVLSGGPDEEPPSVGTAIEVPIDDQHQIVIGGLDGEVIREEFIGDQAEVIGYGPIATDADGNWSVSVDVKASIAPTPPPAPASPLPSAASPSALPSEAPSSVPAPSENPSSPPTPSSLPASSATPIAVPPLEPSPTPAPTPDPALSPTPVPPPEMIGIPEAVAEYVAGLEPKAAGAVRDLTDYLGALGDELIQEGAGRTQGRWRQRPPSAPSPLSR